MKNIVKKNQMIITALAIMIAVAGYLNFAGSKFGEEDLTAETASADISDGAELADLSEEDIYAAQGVVADDGSIQDLASNEEEGMELTEIESLDSDGTETDLALEAVDTAEVDAAGTDMASVDTAEAGDGGSAESSGSTPGEAVLTSATGGGLGVVANAKLLKEQTRAKNKETLLDVINNASITDDQKSTAINSMISMTDIAERETAAEILLSAKGFSDSIVSITDGTVDVMVNASELTDAERAQIEDIVKRKTGIGAEGIVITPILAQ